MVHVDIGNEVAVLTIGNPPLNLITREVNGALDAELSRLAALSTFRSLVVTGGGTRAILCRVRH